MAFRRRGKLLRLGRAQEIKMDRKSAREFEAIEKNPEKPSRWGKLAADEVVQFRDVLSGKYVAASLDGRFAATAVNEGPNLLC